MTTNSYLTIDDEMFEHNASNPHGTRFQDMTGAIEILEWDFKVEQIGTDPGGGRPRSVEAVKNLPFSFTKAVDSRSPKLFYYCCSGEFLKGATLHLFGPTNVAFMEITMGWVHVASFAPAGGDKLALEKIGLKYGDMSVKFNDAGLGDEQFGNAKKGSIETRWSWVLQVSAQWAPPSWG